MPRTDLERRYGAGIHDHTRRLVEAAGLTFHPSPKLPNTLHALQVTELARDRGLHDPVHSRLMHAYWSEAETSATTRRFSTSPPRRGSTARRPPSVLADGRYSDRVVASTQDANRLGINAIPAFVLDGRLLVLGAQPEQIFEQAVEQLEAESRPPGD